MTFRDILPHIERCEPWQIAASRFCVECSEKGFSFQELKDFIQKKYVISDYFVGQFFEEEIQHPSGRQFLRNADESQPTKRWVAPFELVAKITDYDELKEARRNSRNAFWLSTISIIIALASLMVSIMKA